MDNREIVHSREIIQNGVGRHYEELMIAMLEIAKENYLSGKSQRVINEYSSTLVKEALSLQMRVPFMSPSEQEKYRRRFKGGMK